MRCDAPKSSVKWQSKKKKRWSELSAQRLLRKYLHAQRVGTSDEYSFYEACREGS